jgi:hypothetical protein
MGDTNGSDALSQDYAFMNSSFSNINLTIKDTIKDTFDSNHPTVDVVQIGTDAHNSLFGVNAYGKSGQLLTKNDSGFDFLHSMPYFKYNITITGTKIKSIYNCAFTQPLYNVSTVSSKTLNRYNLGYYPFFVSHYINNVVGTVNECIC